ncbi:MAG: hypothetical protein H6Q04_3568 [Acidobacteria bacterium]|nr:hypothetical protein [Acidobacteriota bacterium]
MEYTLKNDNPFGEPAELQRLRVWLTILSGVLAIALWKGIAESYAGSIAQLPSIFEDLGTTILSILCNFADACSVALRNFVNGASLR